MTRLFDLPVGRNHAFLLALQNAGFTLEQAEDVIANPSKAQLLVNTLSVQQDSSDIVARVQRQLNRYSLAAGVLPDEEREHILEQARQFVPATATDTPLVTGLFGYKLEEVNRAWRCVNLDGYTSVRYFDEDLPLRYAPGMKPPTYGPRLVHFDPNAFQGLSPKEARTKAKKDKVRLAGIEVLEMLIVEPEWALQWNGKDNLYPNLSAIDVQYDNAWSHVPYVDRWDDDRDFGFGAYWAGHADDGWASPAVREC